MKVFFDSGSETFYIFYNGHSDIKSVFTFDEVRYLMRQSSYVNLFNDIIKIKSSFHPLVYLISKCLDGGDIEIDKVFYEKTVISDTDILKLFIGLARKVLETNPRNSAQESGEIYSQLQRELSALDTFLEYIPLNSRYRGHLELHAHVERNQSPRNIIHLVDARLVGATRNGDGVQMEAHGGVGYHFHYCTRVNRESFARTRFLLSYNYNENDHLSPKPKLYWEVHSEKNDNTKKLPNREDHRWAIYHRCNAKRLDILSRDKNAIFRNKSNDAELFYA